MNSFCIKLISSQLVCVHREFLNGVPKTGFSIALDDASANFEFYLNQSIAKMHYTYLDLDKGTSINDIRL